MLHLSVVSASLLWLAISSHALARQHPGPGGPPSGWPGGPPPPAGPLSTLVAVPASSAPAAVPVVSQAANSVVPAPVVTSAAPAGSSQPTTQPSSGNGWCINFKTASGTPAWYWSNATPWSGSGDSSSASQCFTADATGGAMFIGTAQNPGAGNTKLECFFPASGLANCDISLVDGYSLSVACTLPGAASIGLSQNLWNNGNACPGTVQNGYCTNPNGYSAAITDVGAFFQPAISTCYIWQFDGLDPEFSGPSTVTCTVSGSAPPSSYTKRDEAEVKDIALDALLGRDLHGARSHAHKARRHGRGLFEFSS